MGDGWAGRVGVVEKSIPGFVKDKLSFGSGSWVDGWQEVVAGWMGGREWTDVQLIGSKWMDSRKGIDGWVFGGKEETRWIDGWLEGGGLTDGRVDGWWVGGDVDLQVVGGYEAQC